MKKNNMFCPCIRCREVKGNNSLIHHARLIIRKYISSHGQEYFISMESGNDINDKYVDEKWYDINNKVIPGIIYGFLRLRLANNNENKYFHEIRNAALVRELHVYGQVVSKNDNENLGNNIQNKGFGKMLMQKAEEISMENYYSKVAVISGIGVRNYYRNLGYEEENTFMIKRFTTFQLVMYHGIKDGWCILMLLLSLYYQIVVRFGN